MSQPNASFRKLLEYEELALAFKPGKSTGLGKRGEWAGVIFSIGESQLTCSIDRVHEFIPPPPVTRVPGTKPWILGLANVRGELVTIVDLSAYLGGEPTPITMRSRLLSATLRGRPVGLLVDEVLGQKDFASKAEGKASIAEDSPLYPYVSKQFKSGSETWSVLDLDTLFSTPEFLNGAANRVA